MLTKRVTMVLSIAVGVSLELGIHWLTGRREAWDSEQVTTMMLCNQEIGGLWPLTIIVSAILSTPFLMAALLASWFRPAAWRA